MGGWIELSSNLLNDRSLRSNEEFSLDLFQILIESFNSLEAVMSIFTQWWCD